MKLADRFIKGFGEAVTDIREKLVEEPWYGRSLSSPASQAPSIQHESEPQGQTLADRFGWDKGESFAPASQDKSHDFDR